MASSTSRYRYSTYITDGQETYLGRRPTYLSAPAVDDSYYTVRVGDDLTRIAATMLGDPRYWWVVADFNGLVDPFAELTPGDELRVPSHRRLVMEVLR